MRTLGLLILLIVFALAFYVLQYWALDFCIGVSFAALCFSVALSIVRKALRGREDKALKEREVKALEEMARQHRP